MEIDYEKAYKAALETATQWIKDGCTDKERICLESAFPQPRESEDERTRKFLVKHVSEWIGCIEHDLKISSKDVESEEELAMFKAGLAYLEKQKEHQENCTKFLAKILKHSAEGFRNILKKKGIDYIPHESFWTGTAGTFSKQECNEFYKWMDDMTMELVTEETPEYKKGFRDGLDASKKEQKLTESISRLTIQGKGVYKICPRCKSRMIRDDSKVYTSMPPQYGYNCPKCGTMEFDTVMYDNPETEEQKPAEYGDEFIAEAEEYASKVNCGEYKVEVTEAYIAGALRANNKPAEWSKEDESQLDDIEKAISNYFDLNHAPQYHYWLEEKLKSLRPQPKQEWSEEDERKLKLCEDSFLVPQTRQHLIQQGLTPGDMVSWLKSLRPPQYCENCRLKKSVQGWKPSEEQMAALDKALYYVPEEIGIPIAEIYGHFNKMKKKLK